MAPTGVTVRDPKSKPAEKASSGLTITSAVVKKGRPTVVKYTWTFNPQKCPGDFAVGVVDVVTKKQIILDESVVTRDHGKNNTGNFTVDITFLKDKPGDFSEVIATSKSFQVKKSDF
ncbi:hypothetical protein FRC04_006622 [Tulasnella sp. 424]|nr:hypothetical protein FRC04_006622 [Tulasnella sp. 424]